EVRLQPLLSGPVMNAADFLQSWRILIVRRCVYHLEQTQEGESGRRLTRILKFFRNIPPVLAKSVCDEPVLDDSFSQLGAVYAGTETLRHVPVVGNLMIIENHGAGYVREGSTHFR